MPYAPAPSLQFLQTALIVMAVCNCVLGVGMFFLMQVRYSQNLSHESRRLSFANLIAPPWDVDTLDAVWAGTSLQDRQAIEEVLVGQSVFVPDEERDAFRSAVTRSGIYTSWLQRLRTGRTPQRVRAAKMLGYFSDDRGLQALARGLRDPSAKVTLSCVLSLGRLKAAAAVPALVSSLPSLPRSIPDVTLAAALAECA